MTKKKTDILFIHGGTTFKKQSDYIAYLKNHKSVELEPKVRWYGAYLEKAFGKYTRIIRPEMPHKDNAKYAEWEIYFKRYLAELSDDYVLIGFSLGGIFLVKYLSENILKKKPRAVYLVAPPFDDSVPGEDLCNGFKLRKDLSGIEKNTSKIVCLFSEDDPCVTLEHMKKYQANLPNAIYKTYKNRGHFRVATFPEIAKMITKDIQG